MQVLLVYLEWFWCNSFLKCVLQPKIVSSDGYDTQQVSVYLQLFSC